MDQVNYQDALAKTVSQMIIAKANVQAGDTISFERYLQDHIVYYTFKPGEAYSWTKADVVMHAAERAHFRLVCGLIGSKVYRKRHLHPHVEMFLDSAGSKGIQHNRGMVLDPHIHGVILLHPNTRTRFLEIARKQGLLTHFEFYDIEKGSLANLIKYCSKYLVGPKGWKDDEADKYWRTFDGKRR